jgi:hypothetical protein
MLGLGDEKLECIILGCHAEQRILHRLSSLRSANASATTTDCKSLSHTLVSVTTPGHWAAAKENKIGGYIALDMASHFGKKTDMANTTQTVPKGPRQIPQGYDD